ncbi:MAG TPA: hypothetical protein VJ932_04095, partial [Alkalispirochaeta sp.]|nr:hypothetical protein [Alkalispirochaeta sp.]
LCRTLLDAEGYADVRLSKSALQTLRGYRWPGNVRELRAVLIRSVVMTGAGKLHGRDIDIDHLSG